MKKHNTDSSQSSTSSSSSSPPTPLQGFGFGGVPYRASITSKLKTTNGHDSKEVGYVSRLDPRRTAGDHDLKNNSMLSPMNQEPYTPSISSPQTPAEISTTTSFSLGWTTPVEILAPLSVRKSIETEKTKFNPESVAKPSYYELEKPYGGTKHFMMAHGLRYYDPGDCEIRKEILEQLKNLEWQNRVNTAREEFAKTGEVSVHLLSEEEVANEYHRGVKEVALQG